mmetsp:Transcript_48829/g.139748  ORF Transcript_48829/g.139748 Transcript_48829/m.139748 type:complete len:514 (-) Transcript_48829:32-1573(-)
MIRASSFSDVARSVRSPAGVRKGQLPGDDLKLRPSKGRVGAGPRCGSAGAVVARGDARVAGPAATAVAARGGRQRSTSRVGVERQDCSSGEAAGLKAFVRAFDKSMDLGQTWLDKALGAGKTERKKIPKADGLKTALKARGGASLGSAALSTTEPHPEAATFQRAVLDAEAEDRCAGCQQPQEPVESEATEERLRCEGAGGEAVQQAPVEEVAPPTLEEDVQQPPVQEAVQLTTVEEAQRVSGADVQQPGARDGRLQRLQGIWRIRKIRRMWRVWKELEHDEGGSEFEESLSGGHVSEVCRAEEAASLQESARAESAQAEAEAADSSLVCRAAGGPEAAALQREFLDAGADSGEPDHAVLDLEEEDARVPEQAPELESPVGGRQAASAEEASALEESLGLQLHQGSAANPGRIRRDSWVTHPRHGDEEDVPSHAAQEAAVVAAANRGFQENLQLWGKRASETAAGKQMEQLRSRCSTKEVEAVLQRPISACQDYDELRRMRKLLNDQRGQEDA